MTFAIHLTFDKSSSNFIKGIFNNLKESKLAPYMFESGNEQHIGLALFDQYDQSLIDQILPEFANSINQFNLNFQGIGIFPGTAPVVFLSPLFSKKLRKIHKEMHNRIKNIIKENLDYYKPNKWIPHCTIAIYFEKNNLGKITEEMNKIQFPFKVKITEIRLIEVPTTLIRSYPIQSINL